MKLGDWPMSHLVMLTGILLALTTGARVVVTGWAPPESWLLFIMGCLTITFATKRATFAGLWRKPAEGTTTTKTEETTITSTRPSGAITP